MKNKSVETFLGTNPPKPMKPLVLTPTLFLPNATALPRERFSSSLEYKTEPPKSLKTNKLKMALPARFERATCGLGNRRSIHLSYGSAAAYTFGVDYVANSRTEKKSRD